MALAIRVNDFLSGLFLGVGIRLVDFKMECGRLWEGDMMRIVVADEISPDSCRLWDIKSNDKLDKDRFRRDLGGLVEAYTEVARRLGIMQENETAAPARRSSYNDGRSKGMPAQSSMRRLLRQRRLERFPFPRLLHQRSTMRKFSLRRLRKVATSLPVS